jgi:hypothetical protein
MRTVVVLRGRRSAPRADGRTVVCGTDREATCALARGFGVLLLTAICAAVIGFFACNRHGEHVTTWLAVSGLVLGGLAVVAVLALVGYATLLGVSASSPWRWIFLAAYDIVILAGLAWERIVCATRRDIYHGIGLGIHMAIGYTATTPAPSISTGARA